MNFANKKWLLVGFVFLVLVNGGFAISKCLPMYDIVDQNISESNGVKLVFVQVGTCEDIYVENQGSNTAYGVVISILDNEWYQLVGSRNIEPMGRSSFDIPTGKSTLKIKANSEEGAFTTAELSLKKSKQEMDLFSILEVILIYTIPVIGIILIIHRKYWWLVVPLLIVWGIILIDAVI